MDRCALFVDAGHLLAEGGRLCCGTVNRSKVSCDYAGLIPALAQFTSDRCSLPLLRTYWYDAAPNAVPTAEQLTIAELPNVKLRLGRLSGGRQKGVDSLIIRDLMTLSRERAVATMLLLGGDEDLREGVVAAQETGVMVVVLGIPTTEPGNQAKTLIREADEHVLLDAGFLSRYFSLVESPQSPPAHPGISAPQLTSPSTVLPLAGTVGQDFANSWAERARPEEIRKLVSQAPVIPKELDVQLMVAAEQKLGPLHERQDLKKDLRAGFWLALKKLVQQHP